MADLDLRERRNLYCERAKKERGFYSLYDGGLFRLIGGIEEINIAGVIVKKRMDLPNQFCEGTFEAVLDYALREPEFYHNRDLQNPADPLGGYIERLNVKILTPRFPLIPMPDD